MAPLRDPALEEISEALHAAPGAETITRLSAIDAVRARILLAIEHRLYAPGEQLPPLEALAEGLDVAPITARRALETLVEDGSLVRRRGRGGGTFVAASPPQIQDSAVNVFRADEAAIRLLIDQRCLMESALIAATAERITTAECDELEALVDTAEQATSWAAFHSADRRFHRRCAELSGLVEATSYQTTYEMLARYFLPYPLNRLDGSHREHRAIVEALRAGDGSRAAAITREHVGSLRRDMFMALPR